MEKTNLHASCSNISSIPTLRIPPPVAVNRQRYSPTIFNNLPYDHIRGGKQRITTDTQTLKCQKITVALSVPSALRYTQTSPTDSSGDHPGLSFCPKENIHALQTQATVLPSGLPETDRWKLLRGARKGCRKTLRTLRETARDAPALQILLKRDECVTLATSWWVW
jgi:hypothetical protein